MDKFCLITTYCNKEVIADRIIRSLLEKKLISCAHKSRVDSSYWWNGKIEEEEEFLIDMKTKMGLYNEVLKEILRIHDYDTSEVACYEIKDGSHKFLEWIEKETKID